MPNLFDSLTRASAQPKPMHALWQTLRGGMAAVVLGSAGHAAAAPAQAATPDQSCMMLNHDATCPPGMQKKPKPGNTPSANGCGPEGGRIKIPQGYGKADYTGSCNLHDYCYEDCNAPKSQCDDDFLNDMMNACEAAYPGITNINLLFRFGCYERAYIYYKAVATFGDDAWLAGQKKACECCNKPTKVYCACNKTCYDDVGVCLQECKVGLGCFAEKICGPADPDQCPN